MSAKFDVSLKNLDYATMHSLRLFLRKLQLKPQQLQIKEKQKR